MEFSHVPVLLEECLEALAVRPSGTYVDGTVGGAGHASHILERLSQEGLLIGIDRDSDALAAAKLQLEKTREAMPEGERPDFRLVKSNYGELPEVLHELELSSADGILLDLGVSSFQLDSAERGFSYMKDAPLDMRMDRDESRTAADLLNESSEAELARILRDYGEERFAGLIAKRIVLARQSGPLKTTGELVRIIEQSIPAKYRNTGGHPAKRTFQAVRIALNHELTTLEECLPGIIGALAPGGRLAVITFHSLEDRIVKNAFRTAENPCICPKDFPVCVCGRVSRGKVVTRKPILPSEEEMSRNPRSASAKLRIFEKAGAGGGA
ncbi:MAG: 16S rRNA (cytosine(1402)-N(4))-methyltransferase RsmH [Lachnospiraceae bacterium]|nr:16S rRNA (cytosine(1402)-N(4))-methyltransferase RsmH [Lachnospiraceae bacterium]